MWDKFEHTKGIIRNRKSKNRQCNDQNKMDKATNADLQNIIQKGRDWTLHQPGVNSGGLEEYVAPAPLVAPVVLLLL